MQHWKILTVVWAPGSYELPLVAQRLAQKSDKYDAVIALANIVIRGGTPHFDYVASEVSKGLANVSLQTGMPISFGVLTTNSIEQAVERAGTKMGNKGCEAALAVLEMVNLLSKIGIIMSSRSNARKSALQILFSYEFELTSIVKDYLEVLCPFCDKNGFRRSTD